MTGNFTCENTINAFLPFQSWFIIFETQCRSYIGPNLLKIIVSLSSPVHVTNFQRAIVAFEKKFDWRRRQYSFGFFAHDRM